MSLECFVLSVRHLLDASDTNLLYVQIYYTHKIFYKQTHMQIYIMPIKISTIRAGAKIPWFPPRNL